MTDPAADRVTRWDLHCQIAEMDEDEAKAHLRRLVDERMKPVFDHEVDRWDLGLTLRERRLLVALVDNAPRVVGWVACFSHTHGDIFADRQQLTGTEQQTVSTHLKRLRKKLPPEIGEIKTTYCLGLSFVRAKQPCEMGGE